MRLRTCFAAAAVASGLMASTAAEAGQGYASASVALRSGPGASYGIITVIPARVHVGVYHCTTWCEVTYGNYHGYATAEFITVGRLRFGDRYANRLEIAPVTTRRGTVYTPVYVKPQTAYISSTLARCHGSVARVWYHDGRWTNRPDYFLTVER